jgi:hypothetical protein
MNPELLAKQSSNEMERKPMRDKDRVKSTVDCDYRGHVKVACVLSEMRTDVDIFPHCDLFFNCCF